VCVLLPAPGLDDIGYIAEDDVACCGTLPAVVPWTYACFAVGESSRKHVSGVRGAGGCHKVPLIEE
jgi:hypothetical protein